MALHGRDQGLLEVGEGLVSGNPRKPQMIENRRYVLMFTLYGSAAAPENLRQRGIVPAFYVGMTPCLV
ncbi:MAG: hypothetical protein M0Z44_06660 [Gammaproteobacteria bacterium]|nr:hypothetical protein [Gammaproteobacteria bacterium]